jgi:O-antigen ligase
MNREALDKSCERIILGLVLTILVFGPVAMGAVPTPAFLVIQGLTLAVMLCWMARLWLSPRPQLFWPPICWAVLAFTAYAVIRYFTADLEYVARLEMVRILIYAFLFLAIVNNLYRQEHLQLITQVLIFLAMAISFYAIYQFVSGSDTVWGYPKPYAHRGSGTYFSPNNLAGFLEMILPLGLAWLLVSRAKAVSKVFVGYASVVILAGIAVTASRGGWASTGVALVALFGVLSFHRTYRLPSLALLLLLLGAGLYFVPRAHFLQSRFKELTAHDRFNDSARFQVWEPAVLLWRENLWCGVGPNHYNYRFRSFRPETEQLQPDRVHNDYLNTLTDWGILGAALVSSAWALLLAGVIKTWRVVRRTPGELGGKSSNKFALVLGASLGLLAILAHSVVDFNMHIPANAIVAITLMALLSAFLRFATDQYWRTLRNPARALATLILLIGSGYLAFQGVRRGVEYAWLERARRAPVYSPAQVAALEKAFAVEPKNSETALAVGRAIRAQCWNSGDGELAKQAMEWFKRCMQLNPYDGYGFMEYGICLDWPLERQAEARPYFDRAVELDPNGYFTAAQMGWHYIQTGDFAAAWEWFDRSKRLAWDNQIADSNLKIVTQKLLEEASEGRGITLPVRSPN